MPDLLPIPAGEPNQALVQIQEQSWALIKADTLKALEMARAQYDVLDRQVLAAQRQAPLEKAALRAQAATHAQRATPKTVAAANASIEALHADATRWDQLVADAAAARAAQADRVADLETAVGLVAFTVDGLRAAMERARADVRAAIYEHVGDLRQAERTWQVVVTLWLRVLEEARRARERWLEERNLLPPRRCPVDGTAMSDPQKTYCTDACARTAERNLPEVYLHEATGRWARLCERCGTWFTLPEDPGATMPMVYCSEICLAVATEVDLADYQGVPWHAVQLVPPPALTVAARARASTTPADVARPVRYARRVDPQAAPSLPVPPRAALSKGEAPGDLGAVQARILAVVAAAPGLTRKALAAQVGGRKAVFDQALGQLVGSGQVLQGGNRATGYTYRLPR